MDRLHPKYGWYLLWWSGLWVLLTVGTQMPECYERAVTLTTGRLFDNLKELAGYAASRLLFEVPLGLFWGSISWLLLWGGVSVFRRTFMPRLLQRNGRSSPSFLWPVLAATIGIAIIEGLILGLPLAGFNTSDVNFDISDAPFVKISDRSILIENIGIVSAFVLPTLIAGYMTGRALPSLQPEQSAV